MHKLINISILFFFLAVIVISCDDTVVSDVDIPSENVSYSEHIQPIFNNYCMSSGCHNTEDNAGGIRLTSYGELFAVPFLVIPGAAEESTLYLSVNGQTANIMPPPYGSSIPLTDNQIDGIRVWIEEGAEAN